MMAIITDITTDASITLTFFISGYKIVIIAIHRYNIIESWVQTKNEQRKLYQ